MKKNKGLKLKRLLITILTIIGLILVVAFRFNNSLKAESVLVNEKSLIKIQSETDQNLDTKGYSLDNPKIILNPYEISPLTALIIFETNKEVSPEIIIKGKNNSQDITHEFESNTKHYLPIYGLYADSDNSVTIIIGEKTYDFNIKTSPLPEDFESVVTKPYFDEKNKNLIDNHLYFVSPASTGYTSAYDIDGEVRWYLTENFAWEIARLNNGNIILGSERLINPPYYTTGFYEISMLGKIYNEFVLPGGYHHDVFEKDNGNLIVASNDFDSGTVEDYIVEIDRNNGNIIKEIDLKDILPMNEGKSENWIEYDWFHNNSVWYDKDTNSLTLSGRHQDIVVNIDYDSLDINYIIGDPETFSTEMQKYFLEPVGYLEWPYSQHAAKITPEGNMFIFDNGNNRSKIKENYLEAKDNYSRGVMYKINLDNMTIQQVFEYGKERKSDYYSSYISDVDYLDKDHYLIHSGGVAYKDGRVLNNPPGLEKADKLRSYTTEVLNNQKIFELVLPNNNYRAEKMTVYAKNENFSKADAKYLGMLNETTVDKSKFGLLLNTTKDTKALDNYNYKIRKESDRLVISGEFSAEDEVSVILYNNFSIKQYNVVVSKRPYTAMCIDIFNEDEKIPIYKYINEEELHSTYSVFIRLNGKTYNTNTRVNFNK